MAIRNAAIGAGFAGFRMSGLHRLAGAATRGRGVILTFHRVRPNASTDGYAPNRGLEITPAFLASALDVVAREGFEIVSLDEAARRLVDGGGPRFAALTFDDGYRDTLQFALPVLERRGAPFTVYCAVGFIERSARIWWLELEDAVRRLETVEVGPLRLPARAPDEKAKAFARVYQLLRRQPEIELLEAVSGLARRAGGNVEALFDRVFKSASSADIRSPRSGRTG